MSVKVAGGGKAVATKSVAYTQGILSVKADTK
jgi:hypothetical protein